MAQSTFNSDLYVVGNLTSVTFSPPNACITDAAILQSAGIQATKLEHAFAVHYATVAGSAVTAATLPLHIVNSASGATVAAVKATVLTAPTSTDTVTVDIKRSTGLGSFSTILTAPVVFSSGSTALAIVSATLASSTLVQGDILQVAVTVSGTSGQGLLVDVYIRENAN